LLLLNTLLLSHSFLLLGNLSLILNRLTGSLLLILYRNVWFSLLLDLLSSGLFSDGLLLLSGLNSMDCARIEFQNKDYIKSDYPALFSITFRLYKFCIMR
jgi:hypothetical protein